MRFQLISLDGTNLENSIWEKLVNATDIKIIQKTLIRKVFFKPLKNIYYKKSSCIKRTWLRTNFTNTE